MSGRRFGRASAVSKDSPFRIRPAERTTSAPAARTTSAVPIGIALALAALAFVPLAACGKRPERLPPGPDSKSASRADVRADPTGTPSPHGAADPHGATDPHGLTDPRGKTSPRDSGSEATSPFAWTCPPGWTEMPTTTMRLANFRPGGDPNAECYLTLLGGDAGGLGANVNRWRAQLALPALDPTAIDALPKAPLLGRDAVLVEASGTWTGMNGMESSPGWGLTGLLLVDPGGSAFLKMTGPAKLVADEREHFLEMAKSIRAARASDAKTAPPPTASEPPAKPTAPASDAPNEASSKDGFAWKLPEGWRRAPDKPMRSATFYAGPGEALECYVAAFPGDVGGVLANVNRWRGQLDLPPLTESDVAALDSVPMLGRKAVIVEGEGKGMQLVGAACPGPDRSVFVKMSGPPELVKAQRAAFLAFCASLEVRK